MKDDVVNDKTLEINIYNFDKKELNLVSIFEDRDYIEAQRDDTYADYQVYLDAEKTVMHYKIETKINSTHKKLILSNINYSINNLKAKYNLLECCKKSGVEFKLEEFKEYENNYMENYIESKRNLLLGNDNEENRKCNYYSAIKILSKGMMIDIKNSNVLNEITDSLKIESKKYFEYIAELTNQIDSCSEEGEEPIILLDNVSHPLIFSHIEECVLKKHGIFKTKGEGYRCVALAKYNIENSEKKYLSISGSFVDYDGNIQNEGLLKNEFKPYYDEIRKKIFKFDYSCSLIDTTKRYIKWQKWFCKKREVKELKTPRLFIDDYKKLKHKFKNKKVVSSIQSAYSCVERKILSKIEEVENEIDKSNIEIFIDRDPCEKCRPAIKGIKCHILPKEGGNESEKNKKN